MSVRPLSAPLQKKSESELHEDPRRTQEDLKHIREWLAKQPHLTARTDDQWLLSFLRVCKFSLERTKEKLDWYYTMRSLAPEFFANRDPLIPEIQECLLRRGFIILSKTRGPADPSVVLIRTADGDPEKVTAETAVKVLTMILDILFSENDNVVVAGLNVVIDLQDLPFKYISQMTPSLLKKAVTIFQNAYPMRIVGVHYINAPAFCETILNLIKSFVANKLKDRIYVYSEDNMNAFYKSVPLSVLPNEYNGNGGTIEDITDEWKLKVEGYRKWFLEDARYGSDEDKRPGKPKTSSEMFVTQGSFRRLSIF